MFFRQRPAANATLSYLFGCAGLQKAVAVDVVAGDEDWFIEEAQRAGAPIVHVIDTVLLPPTVTNPTDTVAVHPNEAVPVRQTPLPPGQSPPPCRPPILPSQRIRPPPPSLRARLHCPARCPAWRQHPSARRHRPTPFTRRHSPKPPRTNIYDARDNDAFNSSPSENTPPTRPPCGPPWSRQSDSRGRRGPLRGSMKENHVSAGKG